MPLTGAVANFPVMTGNHEDASLTRRRAIAPHAGTVAAGGPAVTGCQVAFADEATTGYKGFITLGIDPDASNDGAASGGGGTPPSGAPSDAPTGTPPTEAPGDSASSSASS